MNIKEMLYTPDNKKRMVQFVKYFDGNLWYETETGFQFPVPVSEAGNTAFPAVDTAPLYMRYIRKHIETVENAN